MTTQAWLVIQKPQSSWDNLEGASYHYGSSLPNGRRIRPGDVLVLRDTGPQASRRIFGVARIDELVEHSDGSITALYSHYTPTDIPLAALPDVRANRYNAMNRMPSKLAGAVISALSGGNPDPTSLSPVPASLLAEARARAAGVRSVRDLSLARVRQEANALILPDHVLEGCIAVLRSGKHLLLVGPPGTGKTTLAEALCRGATGAALCNGWSLTTATSDWDSTTTVGTYWLDLNSNLDFQPGIVTEAIAAHRWLVVDELNRADIDKAIGQLFTVMSGQRVVLGYQKRTPSGPVPIEVRPSDVPPEPGYESIEVRPTWRLIATMNSRDRDLLFEMSQALSRRFGIVEVEVPDLKDLKALLASPEHRAGQALADDLVAAIAAATHPHLGPKVLLDLAAFVREWLTLMATPDPVEAVVRGFTSGVMRQLDDLTPKDLAGLIAAARTEVERVGANHSKPDLAPSVEERFLRTCAMELGLSIERLRELQGG